VSLLLAAGANPNIKDWAGETPAGVAEQYGNKEVLSISGILPTKSEIFDPHHTPKFITVSEKPYLQNIETFHLWRSSI